MDVQKINPFAFGAQGIKPIQQTPAVTKQPTGEASGEPKPTGEQKGVATARADRDNGNPGQQERRGQNEPRRPPAGVGIKRAETVRIKQLPQIAAIGHHGILSPCGQGNVDHYGPPGLLDDKRDAAGNGGQQEEGGLFENEPSPAPPLKRA